MSSPSWEDLLKTIVLQVVPVLLAWLGHWVGANGANGHNVPTSTDAARAAAGIPKAP